MVKENMNLHSALTQLGILSDRIDEALKKQFIIVNKKSNKLINGINKHEYETSLISNMNSVDDLIKRRNAIKSALILTNATTKVIICGEEITLAEAIDKKIIGISLKEKYLSEIRKQYNNTIKTIELYDKDLEEKSERHVQEIFGNKEKVTSDEILITKSNYKKPLEIELINPNQLEKLIQKLETEINDFKCEVDSVISTANAVTYIEIEY